MKIKIMFVLMLVTSILSIGGISIANAGTEFVCTLPNGSVYITKQKQQKVLFGPGVFKHNNAWKEAYQHPGEIVPIGKVHKKYARVGLLHLKVWKIGAIGLVYDTTGIHVVNKAVQQKGLQSFSPFFLSWITYVVAYLVIVVVTSINIKRRREFTSDTVWMVFLIAILATTIASVTIMKISILSASALLVAAGFIGIFLIFNSSLATRKFKISRRRVLCIEGSLIAVYFVCVFTSLELWLAN